MYAVRSLLLRNGTNTGHHHRIHNAFALRLDEPKNLSHHIIFQSAPCFKEVEDLNPLLATPNSSLKVSSSSSSSSSLKATTEASLPVLKAVIDSGLHAKSAEDLLVQELSELQSRVNNEIGVILSESQEHSEALPFFEKSNSLSSLFNLSLLHERLGDHSTSLKYMKKASQLGHSGALFNLAVHHYKSGDNVTAKKYMLQAAKAGNLQAKKIVFSKPGMTRG